MERYILAMFPGNRIRALRKRAGLSQVDLAEQVGLSQGQLSNLENGDRILSLEWMRRIAKALGCSVADLLDDDDNPERLAGDERTLIEQLRSADLATRRFAADALAAMLTAARKRDDRAA